MKKEDIKELEEIKNNSTNIRVAVVEYLANNKKRWVIDGSNPEEAKEEAKKDLLWFVNGIIEDWEKQNEQR